MSKKKTKTPKDPFVIYSSTRNVQREEEDKDEGDYYQTYYTNFIQPQYKSQDTRIDQLYEKIMFNKDLKKLIHTVSILEEQIEKSGIDQQAKDEIYQVLNRYSKRRFKDICL